MKTNYLLVLLFVIPFSGNGQTFSHRYDLGFNNLIFTSVLPGDHGEYIVTGIMLDTTPPLYINSVFLKFDDMGVSSLIHPTDSDILSRQMWNNDLFEYAEDTLLVSGYGFDSTGAHGLIIGYNYLGDTLLTKKIYSPFYPEEQFIASTGGLKKFGDDLLFVTNIFNPETNPASNDTYIICLDENLEIKWTKLLEDTVNDYSRSVQVRDSEIIIGSNQNNWNTTTFNFVGRIHLIVLDEYGEVIQNFYYPAPANHTFMMGPANAMVVEEDGSIILASTRGEETTIHPTYGFLKWRSCLIKINSSLGQDQVAWIQPMSQYGFSSSVNKFHHLIKTTDGTGYVAAGTESAGDGQIYGAIAKVSTEGDSLWLRHYQYLTNISNYQVYNDMAETSDGGFIMAGESRNGWPDSTSIPPYQQGWIVKVDEHGCLVPGCHLVTDTKEIEAEIQINLQAYPNPATDFLHLFFKRPGTDFATWQFRIYDLMGRAQTSFQTDFSEMSFILEVQDWATGIYFLEVVGPAGERDVLELLIN